MYLSRKNLHKIIIILFSLVLFLSFKTFVSADTLDGSSIGQTLILTNNGSNNDLIEFQLNHFNNVSAVSSGNYNSTSCISSYSSSYRTPTINTADNTLTISSPSCLFTSSNYKELPNAVNFNGNDYNVSGVSLLLSSPNSMNNLIFKRPNSNQFQKGYILITTLSKNYCVTNLVNNNTFIYPKTASDGTPLGKTGILTNFNSKPSYSFNSYDDSSNWCVSTFGYYVNTTHTDGINSQILNFPIKTIDKNGNGYTMSSTDGLVVSYFHYLPDYNLSTYDNNLFNLSLNNNFNPISVNSSTISGVTVEAPDDDLMNTLMSIKPIDDGVISSFVSIPLKLLNKLQLVFANGVCKPINFGPISIGSKSFSFTYPCYNLVDITSLTFVNIIDFIFCFVIIYRLSYTFVEIFYTVSNLDDLDEIELYQKTKGGL